MILSCYPDFGKAPPEYIVNLIDVLATYPSRVLPKLCDLREGLPAKCSYLPTVSEVVKIADFYLGLDDMEREMAERENQRRVQAEKREEFIASRRAALAKAKMKYKTAFLDVNYDLRYYPDIERGTEIDSKTVVVNGYEFRKPD